MKKILGLTLVLLVSVFVVLRALWLEISVFPKAQSQTPPAPAVSAPKSDAPSDMPIPPEAMQDTQNHAPPPSANQAPGPSVPPGPNPVPPPPVPVLAAPVGEMPPMDGENAVPPSPPQMDPQLKFTNAEGFTYDPVGRRDPFRPFIQKEVVQPISPLTDSGAPKAPEVEARPTRSFILPTGGGTPLESEDVGSLKLVGILWDVREPKAMIRAANSKVYLVKKLSKIGNNNGYVAVIREGELVVIEISQDGKSPTTRVMTLQK